MPERHTSANGRDGFGPTFIQACRTMSLAYLEPGDAKENPTDSARRAKNLRKVHAIIARYAREFAPGTVLAIAQQAVEEALKQLSPLPPNVVLGHHNALRGQDLYRDVR